MVEEHKAEEQPRAERLPAIYEASTGQLAARELRLAAAQWARDVGLDPRLGHVVLYFSKPWVTIDGWYYLFRKKFSGGCLITEPVGEAERKAMLVGEELHAWKASIYDHAGGNLLAVGYGYASSGEKPLARKSAVEPDYPWRMAEKRAEEDAIRKVVPLEVTE